MFCWGSNKYGQLGISSQDDAHPSPAELIKFKLLFISLITCGSYHSLALTSSGNIFSWGCNRYGQLGIGTFTNTSTPSLIISFENKAAIFIAGGGKHSAVITQNGSLFTFGCGESGQLGHETNRSNCSIPKQVQEFMGTQIVQVACGSDHTIVVKKLKDETYSAKIYAFGLGTRGQLGTMPTPTLEYKEFTPCLVNEFAYYHDKNQFKIDYSRIPLHRIYASGTASFLITVHNEMNQLLDMRLNYYPTPVFLTVDHCLELVNSMNSQMVQINSQTINDIYKIFSTPALLNGSFLMADHLNLPLVCGYQHHGVDLEAFINFTKHPSFPKIRGTIEKAFDELLKNFYSSPHHPENMRALLFIPCLSPFGDFELMARIVPTYVAKILVMPLNLLEILHVWFTKLNVKLFIQTIQMIVNYVSKVIELSVKNYEKYYQDFKKSLHLLEKFYQLNNQDSRELIPYETFHIHSINKINLFEDFKRFITNEDKLCFCNYSFVLDEFSLSDLLHISSMAKMCHAGSLNPYDKAGTLRITIRREHVLRDALDFFVKPKVLKEIQRLLVVTFTGEEGLDEGGVRKEFFMLVIRAILDPSYAMVKFDEESNRMWFREQTFEHPDCFELLGILCGLAIYNRVIVDLPFPLALYKKLLNVKVDITDLMELHPSLGHSLKSILKYEGDDFENEFGLTFELTKEAFGEVHQVPLIPNGNEIVVTEKNRAHFVDVYIDYIFNKSVSVQFEAFKKGFIAIMNSPILPMFHPKQLQLFICGQPNYNLDDLEQHITYSYDYSKDHPTIILLWKVLKAFPADAKKKFLLFLTGSDRVPLGGNISSLKVRIQRVDGGPGDERLPVSHTCYNILDLPAYGNERKMKEKLLQAINFTEGFYIV